MTPLLEVNDLRAGHGQAVILQGLSFRIEEGQTTALLGRNGTGKTTLIDTLAGVTQRHGGTLRLASQPFERQAPHARAALGIGWVPQERNIFRSLTVHENLTAVARPPRSARNAWTPERVYQLFPRLAERRSNLGTQLSGGEQQMLAVGRALVLNPRILLLDEPLEGLAPIIAQELLKAIARITREEGLAAIIVEQHPRAILAISHQTVVLDQGRIVHQGRADALLADNTLLDRLLGVARSPITEGAPT